MISSAVKGLCIILIVKRYLWDSIADKDIDDDDAEASAPSPAEAAEEDARVNSVFKITFLTVVFVAVTFGISLFGYIRLSAFIFNRFLLSVVAIGILLVIRKALSEFLHRVLLMRFWGESSVSSLRWQWSRR